MTPEDAIIVADQTASMKEVLTELNYSIWKVPLQISCPVHKLGQEDRPSARIYEDDKSVYCFYCIAQYKATEVWAAMKSVDRDVAAAAILEKWPVEEGVAQGVLRRAQSPYKARIEEVYEGVLERHLINYRGIVEFSVYRKWAKACDEFMIFLKTLPSENKELAIESFIMRMTKDLS
jgi:hypothetical protein